jgi:predicted Rossmann-fold nucleotide-binding protein
MCAGNLARAGFTNIPELPSMSQQVVDAQVSPEGRMEILSAAEVARLLDSSQGGLYELFRSCSLAVLNTGSKLDNGKELLERHKSFSVSILQRERGIKLDIRGAPAGAFVDGEMIKGIREHLFAVLRDVIYAADEIGDNPRFNLATSSGITDAVFHILRNADVLKPLDQPNVVVCWGGHSISREEYDYSKVVGYELGLRMMDICTGCGPGAMKGPMKGAAVSHAKQRVAHGRYLGFTEPGIVAAEAPNPIVNGLVILPDIEKRLEAFVRAGHGIIVFPGGAGTAEEILYLLGILLHPDNADLPFPLIFTGPAASAEYFERIDRFIAATLGESARARYRIMVDDPEGVARAMQQGLKDVRAYRKGIGDAYYFNWHLKVDHEFQKPFAPTHANMRALNLTLDAPVHVRAANLRRAFSGIVAGNVKDPGIRAIEKHGPFILDGDPGVMRQMDELLASFVAQQRMKLPGSVYKPCYRILTGAPA